MPILADSADPAIFKVVLGVIAIIWWGISSIATAAKKKSQQARQTVAGDELTLELTPRMEVAPVPPPRRVRPVAGMRPVRPVSVPPPLPRVPAMQKQRPATVPVQVTPPISAAPVRQVAKQIAPGRSPALDLARALRPESLQTQWLLTEVLAKPLALRDHDLML